MKVRDIMHPATIIEPAMSVCEAAKLMKDRNVGSILVKEHKGKWGIMTERDIMNKVVAECKDCSEVKVSDIMAELKYTIDSNASAEKASEIFNTYPIRRLAVLEDGEVVGVLTTRDIAKELVFAMCEICGKETKHVEKEVEVFPGVVFRVRECTECKEEWTKLEEIRRVEKKLKERGKSQR